MALIKVPELGKRTACHNKPKPYLGYRPGHGMPSCHEPNTTYDTPDGKKNFDKGYNDAFGKKNAKTFQKGNRYKITYKDGIRHVEQK